MTIVTKLEIAGVEFSNYKNLKVSRSMSDFSNSSDFTANFDSPYGRHKTSFTVGSEVVIYADNVDGTTKIFTGILEKVRFKGKENKQTVTLSGRDYTARLMDVTIQPIVYTDSEVSTIIKNIIDNEVLNITYNNVDTTDTTIERTAYNQQTVFNIFQKLAKLSNRVFWIDNDKDLHFKEKSTTASGYTLDGTNILSSTFNQTREGMANIVWVYGDRALSRYQEILSADGGSVFTVGNSPHNTYVEYLGSPQKGGIFGLNLQPPSGTQYLVRFFNHDLIFVSGTDLGYDSIPLNGGSILVQYDRSIPIVKYGENQSSIAAFGPKTKIITDKSIKDATIASEYVTKYLEDSNPFKGIELDLLGWFTFNIGNTVIVNLEDFNISSTTQIINVTYDFNEDSCLTEEVIKVKLDSKILDVTDEIAKMKGTLDDIQAQDRLEAEILPRFQMATGSVSVVGSKWSVYTRSIAGDSLVWGNGAFGIWGTGKWNNSTTTGFVLGNAIGAILGTSVLGTNVSAYQLAASGGYSY